MVEVRQGNRAALRVLYPKESMIPSRRESLGYRIPTESQIRWSGGVTWLVLGWELFSYLGSAPRTAPFYMAICVQAIHFLILASFVCTPIPAIEDAELRVARLATNIQVALSTMQVSILFAITAITRHDDAMGPIPSWIAIFLVLGMAAVWLQNRAGFRRAQRAVCKVNQRS